MKVEYRRIEGGKSKAYLDDEPDALGIYNGEDKYTEAPIRVRWNEDCWQEVSL